VPYVLKYIRKEEGMGRMKDKDLLKLLQKNGWKVVRINGSHHVLQKDGKTTVVPLHGRDVPNGLLSQILKETGLK